MKRILLILISFCCSLFLYAQKNTNADKIKDTKWECKIDKDFIEEVLYFKSENKVLYYQNEGDYIAESEGDYIFQKDTLFITENDKVDMGKLLTWRLAFMLIENKLIPIHIEEFTDKKWKITKDIFDRSYFFIKSVKGGNQ